MRNHSGITLIELIVVISIMMILLSLSTIAFNNYQTNYNIKNEIKTLYGDLMAARMKAMNENRPYVVKFEDSKKSYVTAIDKDENGDINEGDELVSKYSKEGLKYDLEWSFSGNTNRLIFDHRGMVNVNGSVRVLVKSENSSEYDCIVISNSRIKIGKWDGNSCNAR